MKRNFKTLVGGAAVAGLLLSGAVMASSASAETIDLDSWTEGENGEPYEVVDGLVFFKGAQINFSTSRPGPNPAPFKDVEAIALLDEIDGLAYTVSDSASYAPSYQLVITTNEGDIDTDVTYARLVYEPYMQAPAQGPNSGEFTALETGRWWANRVFVNGNGSSPFGAADGSQSSPQPLSFFADYFGETAEVNAISVQQGTTSDIVSVVTSLSVEGKRIDLGLDDETPYSQPELDTALATVPAGYVAQSQLDAANATIATLKADLKAAQVEAAKLTSANADLTKDLKAAVKASDKASYQALKARARTAITVTGSLKVGKTLRAKTTAYEGVKVKYQWYVGGKKVAKATKSTLKLKKAHAKKSVKVIVTKSYKNTSGKTVKVKTTVKATKSVKVAR